MQRITKVSKANLMAADSAEIVVARQLCDVDWRCLVMVRRGERTAYLWGADEQLWWKSFAEARRFVKRFRADLEPTSFDS